MVATYQTFNLDLTDSQKKSISQAYSKKQGLTLRLAGEQLNGTGKDSLLLSRRQIRKLQKHQASNKGADLKISFQQLRKTQQGGALPFLAPLLATAAKTVLAPLALSAASAAVQHGVSKALGSGISINIPKKHVEHLQKVLGELEKRNLLPDGSLLTVDEHLNKQNGGFILPLISTLLGTFLPTLFADKKGSGIYFPFEEKN